MYELLWKKKKVISIPEVSKIWTNGKAIPCFHIGKFNIIYIFPKLIYTFNMMPKIILLFFFYFFFEQDKLNLTFKWKNNQKLTKSFYKRWTIHRGRELCVRAKFLQSCPALPSRLLCPWDSPGKHTGVGCHASSRASSRPRDRTPVSYVSCTGRWVLYH